LSSLVVTSNGNRRQQSVNTVLPEGRLQADRQIENFWMTLFCRQRPRWKTVSDCRGFNRCATATTWACTSTRQNLQNSSNHLLHSTVCST